jgi:hypothetical protein
MTSIDRYRRVLENKLGTVYERLPDPAVEAAGRLHPLAALLTGMRLPVAEISGETRVSGSPARIITAGSGPGVEYLIGRFFRTLTRRRVIGRVYLPRLPLFLERLRGGATLTVARVDRLTRRRLFEHDYLALPEWVGSRLAVPENPHRHLQRSKSLKNDMRKAVKNGLRCRVIQNESAFDAFYDSMYVPFTRNRHGASAAIANIHQLRRVFRSGGLILVEQNKMALSAALFMKRGAIFHLVVFGTREGETTPVHLGTFGAHYAFCLAYAARIGCRVIDFGAMRPNLNDGVLKYKRKWGASLAERPNVHHDLLLYWNRFEDAVIDFLDQVPPIFRHAGGLWGLISAVGEAAEGIDRELSTAVRQMWMPGLKGLCVICRSADRKTLQPGVVGIDPAERGRQNPGGLKCRIRSHTISIDETEIEPEAGR